MWAENVALDVDPGGHLDQLQPGPVEAEHAAFGHVEHGLARLPRPAPLKVICSTCGDELAGDLPSLHDAQLAVLHATSQAAGGEGAGEDDAAARSG